VRNVTATTEPRRTKEPRVLADALRAALEKETDPKLRQWLAALLAGDAGNAPLTRDSDPRNDPIPEP
jgi:hypothetical protein